MHNRSFNSITFPNFSSILHALTKVEEGKFMVFPYGKLRKVPAAKKSPSPMLRACDVNTRPALVYSHDPNDPLRNGAGN